MQTVSQHSVGTVSLVMRFFSYIYALVVTLGSDSKSDRESSLERRADLIGKLLVFWASVDGFASLGCQFLRFAWIFGLVLELW